VKIILIAVLSIVFLSVILIMFNRLKENEKGKRLEEELNRSEQALTDKCVTASVFCREKVNDKKAINTIIVLVLSVFLGLLFAPVIGQIAIVGIGAYVVFVFLRFIVSFLYENEDEIFKIVKFLALLIGFMTIVFVIFILSVGFE